MSQRLRPHLRPLAALLALVLLFFNRLAFTNLILARGDTFLYFYPYWEAAAAALRHGRLPLWNPNLFMGAPLLANSQVGFYYPLNWPLWLLLPAPYAVSASIVLHAAVAAVGCYTLGRCALGLGALPALFAAALFALGGYFTAQVEHVNQLQGLAWLPWVLWAASGRSSARWHIIPGVSAFFALQLLAGHTQSAFITGVALLIWHTLANGQGPIARHQAPKTDPHSRPSPLSHYALRITHYLPLAFALLLALLLAAAQLLPTLELMGLSSRQGGLTLNEVLSFSLHPLVLTRSLLPSLHQPLFSEYVAFLPLTALLLAAVGGWRWRQQPARLAPLALALIGLLLAFGQFNGLSLLLGRLPGFNLFRVPARWLILYALGTALLAGSGLQSLMQQETADSTTLRRPLTLAAALILALIGWGYLAVPLGRIIPIGQEAQAMAPNWPTLALLLGELAIGYWLLVTSRSSASPLPRWVVSLLPPALVLGVLFAASRAMPYTQLTTPEAYFDLRPPITRLRAADFGATVPGRFLSLSEIFFDPGDQAEIDTIYADQLPPEALYDYTIAIKQKEIIAPNLPVAYGLNSIDGFDGGILPLRSYSELMARTLLDGRTTTDGRLREHLSAVPDNRWLDLFNVRYLITDKVGDEWINGIYYDTQHGRILAPGESLPVGYLPNFEATAILVRADHGRGRLTLTNADGREQFLPLRQVEEGVWLADPSTPIRPRALTLTASPDESWPVKALTLFDGRNGTFQPLALGQYRLIHSGDVKIYANLDVLPRALLTASTADLPTVTQTGTATITAYAPERVVIRTVSDQPATLLFLDAAYPGWRASVDGAAVPVQTAAGFFRAVSLPAGQHEVIFDYRPFRVVLGITLSLTALAFWAALLRRQQPRSRRA